MKNSKTSYSLLEKHHLFEVYSLQAMVNLDLGLQDKALLSIQKALDINSGSNSALLIKAYIHIKSGDLKSAGKEVSRVLESDPSDTYAKTLQAICSSLEQEKSLDRPQDPFREGWDLLQAGEAKPAKAKFRRILEASPQDERARIGIVESLKAVSLVHHLYLFYLACCLRVLEMKSAFAKWALLACFLMAPEIVMRVGKALLGKPVPIFNQEALVFVYVLVFAGWLMRGVINFIILTDRDANIILKHEERMDAIFVGGTLVCGLVVFPLGCYLHTNFLVWLGQGMLCAALPWSNVFLNEDPRGRVFYGFCGGYFLIGCLIVGYMMQTTGFAYFPIMNAIVRVGIVLFVSCLVLSGHGIWYRQTAQIFKIHRIDGVVKDLMRFHRLRLIHTE